VSGSRLWSEDEARIPYRIRSEEDVRILYKIIRNLGNQDATERHEVHESLYP